MVQPDITGIRVPHGTWPQKICAGDQILGKRAPIAMLESGCASSVTFMALAQIAGGMGCRGLPSFASALCEMQTDDHNDYQDGWHGQEDEGMKS